MTTDLATLLLYLISCCAVGGHIRATWRARSARGASRIAIAYFAAFCGFQSAVFVSLDQPLSAIGAGLFGVLHLAWLLLAMHFQRRLQSIVEMMG